MRNFDLKNPTKLLFGKGEISKISAEVPANAKVLLLYGGGSIKTNGVYEQVKAALKNFEVVEFSGIPANPEYEVLMKALEIIRPQNITFLLAVGGGSVVDGTKFLSVAAPMTEVAPWDILRKPIRGEEGKCLPFGCVLTLPATGTEMNSSYVISRKETGEKLGGGGPGLYPVFSVLDPEVVRSIPRNQLANGVADAYTHVLEQYMTYPIGALLQDRFAESILQTLQELAPKLLHEDYNYDTAANFMWACTMALNGLIQKGVPTDWAVHAIGHELTAQYGIDHARTLAVVAPSHYRYNFESKKDKLAQYAERCWGVSEGSIEERANAGIEKLENFFQSLDISTKLSAYTSNYEKTGELVEKALFERGWLGIGEHRKLTPSDARKIVEMSF